MFYKFGDNTKAKTIVKSGNDANHNDDVEIFDKSDDNNRRSLILKRYEEQEKEEVAGADEKKVTQKN
jgi:hypothetical protein